MIEAVKQRNPADYLPLGFFDFLDGLSAVALVAGMRAVGLIAKRPFKACSNGSGMRAAFLVESSWIPLHYGIGDGQFVLGRVIRGEEGNVVAVPFVFHRKVACVPNA